MSQTSTSTAGNRTASRTELRRAGLGAVIAAGCLAAWGPLWILLLAPLLGVADPTGAAKFDPVSNAGWGAGIPGLLELSVACGVAVLCIGIHHLAADGWPRSIAGLAGVLWTAGITLHAASFMVQNTPAQTATWLSITDDLPIRAAIGAAVTVTQWGFYALAVIGSLAWTIAHVVGNRASGLVGLGSGVPALVMAGAAMALAVLGIIPPAATFAQLVLLLLIGVPLLLRSRRVPATATS